jgi:hypothetical protein
VSNSVLAASSVPCAVDFPMSPLRRDRKDSFYGPADSVFSTMTEETLVKADWIPSSAKGLIRRGFFGPRAVPPSPLVVMEASSAGHGSVRAGFGPFGHLTRAHRVWNFPTHSSKGNVKNRRVFRQFGRVFGRVEQSRTKFKKIKEESTHRSIPEKSKKQNDLGRGCQIQSIRNF